MTTLFKNLYFIFRYALPICKKYGCKLRLELFEINHGSFSYVKSMFDGSIYDKEIKVGLFSKYFYCIFFHEVGHLVYNNVKKFDSYSEYINKPHLTNCYIDSVVREEAFASRYSITCLKSLGLHTPCDDKMLYTALNAYCSKSFRYISPYKKADIDYKACKMLRYNPVKS